MFFYKIMPVFDLLAAAAILFGPLLPTDPVRLAGTYLIGKGIFFVLISKDIASAFDFIIGLYAISIAYLHFYNIFLSLIAVVFLLQKSTFAIAA
ncbi:MAG: hypothetical protein AABX51_05875 [Nanoarchaeota archaeon]